MSYAFMRDVPVGEGHYAEVRAAIGAAVPKGLVIHLAVRREGVSRVKLPAQILSSECCGSGAVTGRR